MKTELALKLLRNALGWDNPTATREIIRIEHLANVKYDNYRNFEPGRRFLESLVLWLRQFSPNDRQVAYNFVVQRMLYISEVQMDHLVGLLYHQRILPILLNQASVLTGISRYQVKKIRVSSEFRMLERRSLFLGMSDGARMDSFRRKNALHNDQVSVSYELIESKWSRMYEELKKDLSAMGHQDHTNFINIFLIDDFSGSGNSILRISKGQFKGKLRQFVHEHLGYTHNKGFLSGLCNSIGPHLYLVTYVASEHALSELRDRARLFISNEHPCISSCDILDPLQLLRHNVTIPQTGNQNDELLDDMLYEYYDSRIEDEHTRTGGTNVIHGYGECALPLVLSHNCPNNSVYLLWGQTEEDNDCPGVKALFPRISRHLEVR